MRSARLRWSGTMSKAQMPGQAGDFAEDLLDLAVFEFHTAQTLCAACNEYHALWGYGRLAGINTGVATDADFLKPILTRLAPPAARILIAGAADAGLLALTASATRHAGANITVADGCATPLAVCRRYGDSKGLALTTLKAWLSEDPLAGPYDLIFAHNLLLFIPEERRIGLLRNFGRALAAGGRLVLVNGTAAPKLGSNERPTFRNHGGLMAALAARGIPLPESEASFGHRAEILAEAWRARRVIVVTRERIEQDLSAAGFQIEEVTSHLRRRTLPSGDQGEIVPTYAFIARLKT